MVAAKSNPVEAMPSLAAIPAVKSDKTAGLDVPESFKSAVTVVEKKCRNLEKRKVQKNYSRYLPSEDAELSGAARGRHAGFFESWSQMIKMLYLAWFITFMVLTVFGGSFLYLEANTGSCYTLALQQRKKDIS